MVHGVWGKSAANSAERKSSIFTGWDIQLAHSPLSLIHDPPLNLALS